MAGLGHPRQSDCAEGRTASGETGQSRFPAGRAAMNAQASGISSESLRDSSGSVRPGWKTSIASMVCLIVGPSVICSLSFGIFVPYLREAFGWTVAQTGWGVSIMAIMVTLIAPLSGILVDRFGTRRLILTCLPLFGLCFAAMSQFSGALWEFYLAWLLLPILGIGLWPGSWVKATSGWFDERLGLAIAVATLGVGLGAAIMPLLINFIAGNWGWRTAYLTIGLGSIALAWPTAALFIHDAPQRIAPRATATGFAWRPVLRDRATWLLVLGFIGLGLFSSIALVNLVSALEANGMTRQAAVISFSVLGMATIFGRLLCGWMLDRVSIRFVLPAFSIPAGLAIVVIERGATGYPAYACAALLGMLVGAEIDVLGYAVKRFFGLARYGTLYGLIFAIFHLGGAVGAFSMGALHRATDSFSAGLLLGSAGCLLAAIAFTLLPPYRDPGAAARPLPDDAGLAFAR